MTVPVVFGEVALEWLDELALTPGPPWHAMGTRSQDERHWLAPDGDHDEQLAYKQRLLRDARQIVSASLAGEASAVTEAVAVVARAAGCPTPSPSLEDAAALVQDDLCVLVRRDRGWVLHAGVVCFPSMWSLRDKLGLPVTAIHQRVPSYQDELAGRVDRFLDRMTLDRAVWRRNWFIHDTPELHLPTTPPARLDPAVPDGLWLRSERQTLRRLRTSGAVLFTIRTQQVPLGAVAARPDVARRMAAAVAAWSPALVEYRHAAAWREEVLRFLIDHGS